MYVVSITKADINKTAAEGKKLVKRLTVFAMKKTIGVTMIFCLCGPKLSLVMLHDQRDHQKFNMHQQQIT